MYINRLSSFKKYIKKTLNISFKKLNKLWVLTEVKEKEQEENQKAKK
jgi:hypothetical protein